MDSKAGGGGKMTRAAGAILVILAIVGFFK
jgi:hypothetical protein